MGSKMKSPVRNKLMVSLVIGLSMIVTLLFTVNVQAQDEIEEIVVTARKINESLQDVSIGITAVSKERLEQGIITDIENLQYIVPSLQVGNEFGLVRMSMRGLGNTASFSGEDPDVVLHVDGAVVGRPDIQDLAFLDLERIEVLRGPQGTLYGRNSTAGTINLITAKPTEEFEGYLGVTGGNYNYGSITGAASGPISDKILGRVAFSSIQRDGFSKNLVTLNDVNDEKRQMLRAQLQFNISDDVQLLLSGEYGKRNDKSGSLSFLREFYLGADEPASSGRGGFPVAGSRDVAQDFDPHTLKKTSSFTATLDWRLNEQLSTRTIFNYRDFNRVKEEDLDASAIKNGPTLTGSLSTWDYETANGDQWSAEFQLIYQSEKLTAIGGLYLYDETLSKLSQVGQTAVSGDNGLPWLLWTGVGDTDSSAAFWNLKYDISDQFAIRAGGRYTDETRKIDNNALLRFGGRGPRFDLEKQIFGAPLVTDGEKTFSEYTSELGIDYKVTEDALFFYTYSEGFKSGAGLLAQISAPIIEPTFIENHEFGIKTQWLDRRLTVNINGFVADVKGLQREATVTDPTVGLITLFTNIEGLDISGLEMDAMWIVNANTRISAAAAYLDAEFGNYTSVDALNPASVGNPEAALVQLAGNPPLRSPDWRINLFGEHDFHLENTGILTAGLEATYTGDQLFDENSVPARAITSQDAYTLVNANLMYTPPGDRNWYVNFWVKNLTDEQEFTALGLTTIPLVIRVQYTPPLTFGVSWHSDF